MSEINRIVIVKKETDYSNLVRTYASASNVVRALSSRGSETYAMSLAKDSASYEDSTQGIIQQVAATHLPYELIDVNEVPLKQWTNDMIVVLLGPDGLLANVGKYIRDIAPVICVNPSPQFIDGLVMKHSVDVVSSILQSVLNNSHKINPITLAQITTNEGSTELAINDFLIARENHASAYYGISINGRREKQGSSGVLISVPLGATGWLASCNSSASFSLRQNWSAEMLHVHVREAFQSRTTQTGILNSFINPTDKVTITSYSDLFIYSDGDLKNGIPFSPGTQLTVTVSDRKLNYVS
jgi:NAD kinase